MASELITEDGTGVADANSYASADEARAYATLRGVALPAAPGSGQDQVEIWLVLATDYLESLSYIYYRATTTQALSWPRKRCFDTDFTGYVLPDKLKAAQMQLVIEQKNGVVLMPSTPGGIDGQFVIREKVDVIETAYSEKIGTLSTPTMPAVDALLRGLVTPSGLRSVRV